MRGIKLKQSIMNSKAQIIVTIGPATKDKEIIKQMMMHQMDIVRLNFSWGNYTEHEEYIKTVREVANELGTTIPIIPSEFIFSTKVNFGIMPMHRNIQYNPVSRDVPLDEVDIGLFYFCNRYYSRFVGSKNPEWNYSRL